MWTFSYEKPELYHLLFIHSPAKCVQNNQKAQRKINFSDVFLNGGRCALQLNSSIIFPYHTVIRTFEAYPYLVKYNFHSATYNFLGDFSRKIFFISRNNHIKIVVADHRLIPYNIVPSRD